MFDVNFENSTTYISMWHEVAKATTWNFGFFEGRGHHKAYAGCGQALFWRSMVFEDVLKIGPAFFITESRGESTIRNEL